MQERYDPAAVESAAQNWWAENRSFEVREDPDREKFYCLSMFPYPSGRLHIGHVRNYTIGDVIARFQRMQGRNVLQPIGWDAFGLPAENAALKNQVPPGRWTRENIAYMKGQLQALGFAYDWSRELATCDPGYYRWEQWLFTRLLAKGLVYRKSSIVNWDPVDNTVLANEQVIEGRGWRSGALVEQREIPQWFLKISDYADELLNDLDKLQEWPEAVRTMQRNWIGRSEGVEVDFDLATGGTPLRIYTTRPDTIFGATFMAVAVEHPLALEISRNDPRIAEFCAECRKGGASAAELETAEKTGMPLGVEAINPLSGERIPVYVANFVLMSYGTGAIMSVPAHDERDHAFAVKYGLPIRQVIAPADGSEINVQAQPWTSKQDMVTVNSGAYSGLSFAEAFDRIADGFEAQGRGRRRVNFRLRDWGVSRQRYWGCPIPVIYCDSCGPVPVPEADLPVVLPEDVSVTGGASPLQAMQDWVHVPCPGCGEPARRETDTFDTFFESSWYYARFACPDQDASMLDSRASYWTPVDQYVGGIEHAILHLLYARFFHKLMRDEGLVDSDEPFRRLLTQGMVLADCFYRTDADGGQAWYSPLEVESRRDAQGRISGGVLLSDGQPVNYGGMSKMSKSRNNGIDPQVMIDRYGADTVRLFIMFAAPPEQTLEFSESGVEGAYRFLKRLWKQVHDHVQVGSVDDLNPDGLSVPQQDLRRKAHETLHKAGDDIGRRATFNTAIAAAMELLNAIQKFAAGEAGGRAVVQEALEIIVLILAPITPHVGHALWQALGRPGAVVDQAWPAVDESALARESVELVVQVNGKLRGRISVSASAQRDQVLAAALAEPNVQRFVDGRELRKQIVVPGKLVNLVV